MQRAGITFGLAVVLLLLVTSKVSLPVGFRFYQPDPAVLQWKKADDALKQQGVRKCERPPKPARNPAYPSKPELLLDLLREFRCHHPQIRIKAMLADALYGSARFMNQVADIFAGVQTVSQLQQTQIVRFRNRDLSVAEYFRRYPGVEITLRIRGGKEVKVVLGSARLFVKAHERKGVILYVRKAKIREGRP